MSMTPRNPNILAIVQARLSSSRLPRKVLLPILGKSMILHELERLQRSRLVDCVVLATSEDASDDKLAETVSSVVDVYRGSLNDVLGRYYQCAKQYRPKHIVRITGDCPVIDWRLVDEVVQQHLAEGNDYTALTERFPDGLDTEVFNFSALERSWREAILPSEREHVTQYIRKHPEMFQPGAHDSTEDLSSMRWTVDEPEDFDFITKVFEALYPSNNDFDMRDILSLLEKHPEWQKINSGIARNEGLLKSLDEDKKFMECRK